MKDKKRPSITTRLSQDEHIAIKLLSIKNGVAMQDIFLKLIQDYIKKHSDF